MNMLDALGNRVTDFFNGDSGKKREDEERQERRIARGKAAFDRAGGDVAFGHPGVQYAGNVARQGMANHAKAIDDVTDAIAQEMDSRVAQEREMRRMEHEKELARIRAQADKMDRDGALIRDLLNG